VLVFRRFCKGSPSETPVLVETVQERREREREREREERASGFFFLFAFSSLAIFIKEFSLYCRFFFSGYGVSVVMGIRKFHLISFLCKE
jgi:hypothetical protein